MAEILKRRWFAFAWLHGRSWWVRGMVLAMLAALAVVTFVSQAFWVAFGIFLAFFVTLNVIVYRRGGWGLLGPHFYYDVVRLARRGRSTVLRVLYILALFGGLALVYANSPSQRAWTANDSARVSEHFAFALFLVQNLAVMLLAPAYLGSAIAEEKERRTLELLFTTQLSNTEIVLGKLTSRVIHLIGFVVAGTPVLAMVQFWGGIDMLLIAGNLFNTLLNIVSIGSICLLASVLARTVTGAVMTSYAVILPMASCCGGVLRGFPFILQDARSAGGGMISVQDLGILCLVHLVIVTGFLSLAIAALRETEPLGAFRPPLPGRLDLPGVPTTVVYTPLAPSLLKVTAIQLAPPPITAITEVLPDPPSVKREVEPENDFSIPYTLPPVTDNALLWKERYSGGPAWFFTPVVLVPALPFLLTGFLVLGFWFIRSLFLDQEEFRRAVEAWSIVLRLLYYGCLAAYVLGVGFRAASSVARERQQQTLDPLLLLPIDRSEILWAKLLGSLWRGWPWLALLAFNLLLGTFLGAYHPFSAVLLAIAPWAVILFMAGLGLFLSVQMATVLRANIVLLVVVILLISSAFVLPFDFNPLTYLEPAAFGPWPTWHIAGDFPHFTEHFIRMARGLFVAVLYFGGAALLLRMAFVLFENRAHQAES